MHGEFHWVERIFAVLQIITACLMAFSHGANDAANAIGPLAAIIAITETGSTTFQAVIPTWILVLGGVGIVAGLGTINIRVIRDIVLAWIVIIPAGAVLSIVCYYIIDSLYSL